jgi:hypothetical protein
MSQSHHGNDGGDRTMIAAPSSGGMPVPRRVCEDCGEFLPHACAPVITILRAKWTGRRVVRIQDRQQQTEPEREAG